MRDKDFSKEIEKFISLIESKNPLSFFRYGDGEIMLINGEGVGNFTQAYQVDKWSSPNHKTLLGEIIEKPLLNPQKNWYFGIPCQCCNNKCKQYILNNFNINDENLTYANLFVNNNYRIFKNWISSLKESVILINNHNGIKNKYPFGIEKYIATPDDCVSFFQKNHTQIVETLKNEFSNINDKLVLVSSGPLAKAIIYYLSIINNTNRYIDVGSALDEYTHLKKTRPYMVEGTDYNNKICIY